ncbi:unnamed protein product [Mytilus coruscus]|uniref:Ig-like domain-containing protein n=1 Tax=Mytilus coruscus TaxID=42192 RepID=A0A6J8A382_MYTCO|nr:unnamed protein product [Mytilus coruscus]
MQRKNCLVDLYNNIIDINTESAIKGDSIFYEFKKKLDSGDSPKVLSVILNERGEEVVYCEDTGSRNESGSAMAVHLESTTNSSIDIELKSDCDDREHCTGVACNRCYFHPPVVTISVLEPVVIDDNATIICRILPLTRDTQILWFMSNGTFSRTIHNSDKYQVTTSKTMKSSFLVIYLVQHEDELNYSCQAINFIQTGMSNQVQFTAVEFTTENITSTDHNLTTPESNLYSNLQSNMSFSTNPKMTSSPRSINTRRKLTTLKLSSTSKYITTSSSVKGASGFISRISSTTKPTTSLTNVKSVNTAITKDNNMLPSVTIPDRTSSLAVSSTRKSTTISSTGKATGTITPTVSPITKQSTASLCDKTHSSTFEALRSTVGIHVCYIKMETYQKNI